MDQTVAASGAPGSLADPGAPGSGPAAASGPSWRLNPLGIVRWLRRIAGVVPFGAYVTLGLLLPMVAVAVGAFQNSNGGGFTFSNISAATHGIYLKGFWQSIELSVITALLPGIFGLLIAYAIFTAKRARPRGATSRRPFIPAGTIWRWVVLILAGVYFLIPLWAALRFAGISAFGSVVNQDGLTSSLGLSVRLAVVTTVITIVLMLPTTVYVHLRLPKLRRLLEGITILPIVIPPVVLIVGVLQIVPGSLKNTPYLLSLEYVVLAMPFAFRAIDAGLRALDLKTIVEASSSLGAGWC